MLLFGRDPAIRAFEEVRFLAELGPHGDPRAHLEAGHDELLDGVEERPPRVAPAAEAEGDTLRRRLRGHGQVRELVLDEMLERDLEVVTESLLRLSIERRREASELVTTIRMI